MRNDTFRTNDLLADSAMIVFSGTANKPLAEAIVERLNLPLGKATVERFSDVPAAVLREVSA